MLASGISVAGMDVVQTPGGVLNNGMVDTSGFIGGIALVAGSYARHGNVRHDG